MLPIEPAPPPPSATRGRDPQSRSPMLPIKIEPGSLPVEVLSTGEARATKAGVRRAPLAPGCYIFSDAGGAVLYVGKSVALRDRLSSYFLPKRDGKTRAM